MIREIAEGNRPDRITNQKYRPDHADGFNANVQIFADYGAEHSENIHGVGVETITEPRSERDEQRLFERDLLPSESCCMRI